MIKVVNDARDRMNYACRPTFVGYAEPELRAMLRALDPKEPTERETKADIERRLVTFFSE